MSDFEAGASTPGKAIPWTDEAKVQFLLRIIAQLREDGRSINWSRLKMDGRTTKSLQNMWTKINKEISDIEAAENGASGAPTPTKPKTPRRGRAKKVEKSEAIVPPGASDDEDALEKKVTPKKRGAGAARAGTNSAKKPKLENADDEKEPKSEYDDAAEV